MPEPRTAPGNGTELSRRDFLTARLPGRIAALLGGGAAAVPATTTADAARDDPGGSFSPGDLSRMSRDEVRGALARIRAQRRGR
jgi:hypothetical protein